MTATLVCNFGLEEDSQPSSLLVLGVMYRHQVPQRLYNGRGSLTGDIREIKEFFHPELLFGALTIESVKGKGESAGR